MAMTDANSPQAAAPLSAAEDKQWATFAHFGNIIVLIPALIIYVVFKDRGQLVRQESKEALNWTINVAGALLAIWILEAIFTFIPLVGWVIDFLLLLATWAVLIVNVILAIMGGVRVANGGTYRYPANIRWIK
jgi:uncharacterized protein